MGTANVCTQRTREPVGVVRIEEVVSVAKRRVVGVRSEDEWCARRPASDALRGEPDGARSVHYAATSRFSRHEMPERGDVLVQLPIREVGSVLPQIAQLFGDVVRVRQPRQHGVGIERTRNHWRRRHQPIVILVPENELAGRHTVIAEARDRRLRDAVMESKMFCVRLGSVALLRAAGNLGDAGAGVQDGALRSTEVVERRPCRRQRGTGPHERDRWPVRQSPTRPARFRPYRPECASAP